MKFTPGTIPIAIERADGGVSIMSLVVTGRGSILPEGAQWLDQKTGTWARVATPAIIGAEVVRAVPDAVSWKMIDESILPKDRTFRNALKHDMTYDLDKARQVLRNEIRHARAKKFADLDAKWMRAQGQGKKAEADAIEVERQKLRDAPADPRIEAATSVEELRTLMV